MSRTSHEPTKDGHICTDCPPENIANALATSLTDQMRVALETAKVGYSKLLGPYLKGKNEIGGWKDLEYDFICYAIDNGHVPKVFR